MGLRTSLASLAVAGPLFGSCATAQVQPKGDEPPVNDYMVGLQDVLTIASYDKLIFPANSELRRRDIYLSADRPVQSRRTYPPAGGRRPEATAEGFRKSQITVAVEVWPRITATYLEVEARWIAV